MTLGDRPQGTARLGVRLVSRVFDTADLRAKIMAALGAAVISVVVVVLAITMIYYPQWPIPLRVTNLGAVVAVLIATRRGIGHCG